MIDNNNELEQLKVKCAALQKVIQDIHWMARRYADGRMSYSTKMFNDAIKKAMEYGVELRQTDGTLFARDGMGRAYDGLSDAEANEPQVEQW